MEKLFEKNASQVRCSRMQQHNNLTGGTPLHAIPFYGEMIVANEVAASLCLSPRTVERYRRQFLTLNT